MSSVGEQLRRAREAQGRSIEDIESATRISRKFLRQLEEGIIPKLPETYIHAFIKAYARQVGINPAELLEHKDDGKVNDSVTGEGSPALSQASAAAQASDREPDTAGAISNKSEKRHQVNILLVLSIVVVAGLIVSVFLMRKDRKSQSVQEISFSQAVKEHEDQQKSSGNAPESFLSPAYRLMKAAPSDSLVLEAVASESTWIRIVPDGAQAKEFRLAPQNRVRMKSKNFFLLSLDNARGVSFVLNGRKIGELDKNHKPMYNVTFSWDTFQELQRNAGKTE